MNREQFIELYRGKEVFGHPSIGCYEKAEDGVRRLRIKEGEMAHIQPFSATGGQAGFTVKAIRSGRAFGQITWRVV